MITQAESGQRILPAFCERKGENEMSMERAKAHLARKGYLDRVIEPAVETATVEQAAAALGCAPAHIAKTMSFYGAAPKQSVLIVAAGDCRVDNRKFKDVFHFKPRMIAADEVEARIGHAPGGVCAFGICAGVQVYCDVSLQRFETVYPAAGNDHSGVRLSCSELFDACDALGWVDVCKGWA